MTIFKDILAGRSPGIVIDSAKIATGGIQFARSGVAWAASSRNCQL